MSNAINFLAIFSAYFLDFLLLFVFLRVILSWFPIPPGRFTNFLREVTNPIFQYMYKFPFSRVGILDLSPILAYFALEIMGWILRNVFLYLGASPGIYGM